MPPLGHRGSGLSVLVATGDRVLREELAGPARALGCGVTARSGAPRILEVGARSAFDLAFLEVGGGDAEGSGRADAGGATRLALLPVLLAANPRVEVVVVTAGASVALAVEAIQRGARDYLPRPFTAAQVRHVIERVATRLALERQVTDLRSRLSQSAPEVDLETRSPQMRALLGVLGGAAAHDVPVLLRGDGGSGRSVLARRLHALSARRDHPLVVVNCATRPEESLAAALFGRAADASIGADDDQPGAIEAAAGGTLFFDEVTDVPLALQGRLVRLLDAGEFEREGERRLRVADVRVVAATSRELPREVAAGRFRQELAQRLDTVEIHVPLLRDRPEDILPLAERFLAFFGRISPHGPLELTPAAAAALRAHPWPGNVRELRNAIERAVLVSTSSRIGPELLPGSAASRDDGAPFVGGAFTLDEIEREHTLRVMAGSPSLDEAAAILGIDAQELWRRRRRYEER